MQSYQLLWLGASGVMLLSVMLGYSMGQSALPDEHETASQYAVRIASACRDLAQELVVQALLAVPGLVTVATSNTPEQSNLEGAGAEEKREVAGLRQDAAVNELEINAQQEVSARRYAELRDELEKPEDVVVLPEQPDDVRARMAPIEPNGIEMRCDEAIPPASSLTTRSIELQAKSLYQGKRGNDHSWKYVITFINHGSETVQMLTRHWVFVDAHGKLTEIKGPGARGVTPVLPPGGEWNYESGTSLSTSIGSMHGSFQFEVLRGDRRPGLRAFSARVARLLLSAEGAHPQRVPCAPEAAFGLVPASSVLAVERVILGGRADFAGKSDNGKFHRFKYDVQFNNARDTAVEIVSHSWEVVDSEGRRKIVAEGVGVGGSWKKQIRSLAAGDAFRAQGVLSSLTPEGNAQGTYKVIIKDEQGQNVEIEARTDWMGLAADSKGPVPNFVADKNWLAGGS